VTLLHQTHLSDARIYDMIMLRSTRRAGPDIYSIYLKRIGKPGVIVVEQLLVVEGLWFRLG